MAPVALSFLALAALASASPVLPRTVSSLDQGAVAEAQQRDNSATRAFSNVEITTSDGRCLFVDALSGDFRENLTPIQIAACGSTQGQGWDVITAGVHNNVADSMLIVSTLTEACFNFDPRRAAGNQVLLFSCGGRADGGGAVSNSQLFSFNGTAGPLPFEPENQAGSCLTVSGNVVDIATCNAADPNQSFTFGAGAAAVASGSSLAGATSGASTSTTPPAAAVTTSDSNTVTANAVSTAPATAVAAAASSTGCTVRTRTVTVQAAATTASASDPPAALGAAAAASSSVVTSADGSGILTFSPTTPVPVSGAGGTLNPTAVAQANPFDSTATFAFTNVTIRDPNGLCLLVDPTAGDFRENLIPITSVTCAGTPNERWDIITAGAHNDQPGTALVVSALTNGCISFDGRRQAGDTVNMFSCGGRADGSGQTNADQLFPFLGEFSFAFAPTGENNQTCILPGDAGRLVSGACPTDGSQLFAIFP